MTSRWAAVPAKTLLARTVLIVGAAVASLSGCACERPGRGPPMGKEVPPIRVRLGDDAPVLTVAVKGPWTLAGPAGEIASGDALDWTGVRAQGGLVAFGEAAPVAGPVELRGTKEDVVWLRQPLGGSLRQRGYRGSLRLAVTPNGALRPINVLPMEAYVAGVVANELLKSWHVEAYKAQAVAARTYALAARNARLRYDYDVHDSQSSQVYGGCSTETPTAWEAVQKTWGVVATYRGADGKPVLLRTYYSSTCGGETAPAGSAFGGTTIPPLVGGVKCTYCRNSPKYRWPDVTLTKQQVTEALRAKDAATFAPLGQVRQVEVVERQTPDGRATKIRILGETGKDVFVRAGAWRLMMGARTVPSTWFEIQDLGDRIVLTGGRGYGHGVGLCQWGAEFLARHGKTGEEILRYYYPGVELVRAY